MNQSSKNGFKDQNISDHFLHQNEINSDDNDDQEKKIFENLYHLISFLISNYILRPTLLFVLMLTIGWSRWLVDGPNKGRYLDKYISRCKKDLTVEGFDSIHQCYE